MPERKTKEQFIEEAKLIHGDKYDYSEVEYLNTNTSVKIFCRECQRVFYQTPKIHLRGSGCNLHSNNKRKSKEQFIEEAKLIHGDKYDYSEVEYLNANTTIKIFCKECQRAFYQTPSKHINAKRGCNCYTKRKLSNLDFVKEYEHCKTKEDYLKEYEKIISNKIEYGGELHHIKPRSLFPELKDDNSNLVRLSFENHYRAHFLLFERCLRLKF